MVALLVGCSGGSSGKTGACRLADQNTGCPECYDGDVTCSYDGTEVTAASCGDCQARSGLYVALCDAGVEDSKEDIEAGTTCSDPDTGG
jgi:hypothetical protein